MKWAEELGSGKMNIRKYAPMYYDKTEIEIHSGEEFIFSITYRDPKEFEMEDEGHRQVTDKLNISWDIIKVILSYCSDGSKPNSEIIVAAGFKDRDTFMKKYIKPLIDEGFLEMDIPDKPNSRLQRYYTTEKGKALLAESAS